jgi:hypothetical protein
MAGRRFRTGLQHVQRPFGLGLAALDLEVLLPMGDLDLQRRLDGAQVFVHGAAQVRQPGVVGRREGVAKDQADNPCRWEGAGARDFA